MKNIYKQNIDIVRNKLENKYIIEIYLRTQIELVAYTKTLIQTWLFEKALKDTDFQIKDIDINKATETLLCEVLLSTRGDLIQKSAVAIGYTLGGKSPSTSADRGAELLVNIANKENLLFDLEFFTEPRTGHTFLRLLKKIRYTKETQHKLNELIPLPPKSVVLDWDTNHKFDEFTKTNTSALLGRSYLGNKQKQCLSILNILQKVTYKLDMLVFVTYANTNKTMDKEQFLNTVEKVGSNPFYFEWQYDKRGRSYSAGYFLNLQSSDYFKSLLSLNEGKPLNEAGYRNLKCAIANVYGRDKETWEDREKWFNNSYPNMSSLDDLTNCTITDSFRMNPEHAEEPIMAFKLENALIDAAGKDPVDVMVSFDATNSGYQVYSILTGDLLIAEACNLLPIDEVRDFYTEVATDMNKYLEDGDTIVMDEDIVLNEHIVNKQGLITIREKRLSKSKGLTRKKVKAAIMTVAYNSIAEPKKIFNEKQLSIFEESLLRLSPHMVKLRNFFNTKVWDNSKLVNRFFMPDGHEVVLPNFEKVDYDLTIEEMEDFVTPFSCYENKPTDRYLSLVVNVIHAVDGYIAREMVRLANQQGYTLVHIHDCFKVHPNDADMMIQNYRCILSDIAKSDLLNDIIGQLTNNKLSYPKEHNNLSKLILKSKYALT